MEITEVYNTCSRYSRFEKEEIFNSYAKVLLLFEAYLSDARVTVFSLLADQSYIV
jgi:hypothetical protein